MRGGVLYDAKDVISAYSWSPPSMSKKPIESYVLLRGVQAAKE